MSDRLVPYGIQNEHSDLRAHVCPIVRRVYVFPTAEGVAALPLGSERTAMQLGVKGITATGRAVPVSAIRKCIAAGLPDRVWEKMAFDVNGHTGEKGRKAVRLVAGMIQDGLFPIPIALAGIDTHPTTQIDIEGTDIHISTKAQSLRIQVKCDYRGGEKELGGTGNLYLQTAERNPLKRT